MDRLVEDYAKSPLPLPATVTARDLQTGEMERQSSEDWLPRLDSLWPLPVAGLAWLAHVRFRRRFPEPLWFGSLQLTSLKYAELYGLGGVGAVSALETIRRRREVLRDPDLDTLDKMGAWMHLASRVIKDENTCLETESFKDRGPRSSLYPTSGGFFDKLAWRHNHMWSTNAQWNAAYATVISTFKRDDARLSARDLDNCVTYVANVIAGAPYNRFGSNFDRPLKEPLLAVTIGLSVAREFFSPKIVMALNGVQRVLIYALAYVLAVKPYEGYVRIAALPDAARRTVGAAIRAELPRIDEIGRLVSDPEYQIEIDERRRSKM